jgi:hypothetical protein
MKTKKIVVKPKSKSSKSRQYKRMKMEDLLALPLEAQRVKIAKDAIALLNSSKIQAHHMGYLDSNFDFYRSPKNDDERVIDRLRRGWKRKDAVCGVCAIGSLFVGALDTFNSLKLSDVNYTEPGMMDMLPYLARWWPKQELRVMEAAFEGTWQGAEEEMYRRREDGSVDYCEMHRDVESALAFSRDYPRGSKRMVAILNNIIKNDGDFCP